MGDSKKSARAVLFLKCLILLLLSEPLHVQVVLNTPLAVFHVPQASTCQHQGGRNDIKLKKNDIFGKKLH